MLMALCSSFFCAGATFANPTVFTGDGTDQTREIQALFNKGGDYVFQGTVKTGEVHVSGQNLTIDFADRAVLEPASQVNVLWQFDNSNITLKHINVDGKGMAQTAVKVLNGTFRAGDVHMVDLGYPSQTATDMVAGLWLEGTKSVAIRKAVFADFHSVGVGAYGNGRGAVRGIVLWRTGPVDIGTFEMSGGDGKMDNDYFQAQLGTEGGVIHNVVARYNGYTRRIIKIQSGQWTIENVDIRKGPDFVADNPETEAGTHNLNAIDYATSAPGKVVINGGYMDCTGFAVCVSNSGGGGAQVIAGPKLVMEGSTHKVIRNDPGTGGKQNNDSIGFYTQNEDGGSGIEGATLVHFGVAAVLRGQQSYAKGAKFVDPVHFAAQIGEFNHKSSNQRFVGNEVSTRTPGYLKSGVVSVLNAKDVKIADNKFTEEGNSQHAMKFFDFKHKEASGSVFGNHMPARVEPASNAPASISVQ